MLLSSVSNLSRSAKMHSGFFISSGLQVDSTLVETLIQTYRATICQNFKRFRRFILHLFVSSDSILIWYLKREYPNTQLSNIKAVSVYSNVLKWGSRNWCENLSVSSSDSDGRMLDILHWTELRALINGPLVDRQFPPLQGVELSLSWAECNRSFSSRSSALSLSWPQRTAGRQPAVSTPRLAHNWANRDKHFYNNNLAQKTYFRLFDLLN